MPASARTASAPRLCHQAVTGGRDSVLLTSDTVRRVASAASSPSTAPIATRTATTVGAAQALQVETDAVRVRGVDATDGGHIQLGRMQRHVWRTDVEQARTPQHQFGAWWLPSPVRV